MLRKFVWWFIMFGLSFVVQSWGWADQGTAFLWIKLGGTGILFAVIILICLFAGDGFGERFGLSFVFALGYGAMLAITLFATWGATKLFNVDFNVAFQIMTFGQCLCRSSKTDD